MHIGLNRINRSGGMFSGAVSYPGMPLLELPAVPEIPSIPIQTVPTQPASQPERSLSGFVLSRLTSLKPTSDELKARLQEAISEAASLLAECDAIEQECHSERLDKLQRQHDAIRAMGRKQLALIKKLEKEFAQANGFWNDAKEARQQRRYDLEQLVEDQRGLSRWSSDREVLDLKIAISQAKEALRLAIEADNQAMQRYSQADSALASAKATLAELAKDEEQVRSELSGSPHFDAHLGLEVR